MALLIKQGLIYDGTDAPPVKQDIFIRGQQIVRLGSFSSKDAETVIDARGAVVTPGFIDLTNAADHYFSIFTDPFQEDLIKQGVTTIIGGNDGFSLAPFFSDSLNYLRRRKSVFQKINVHWQTVKEFLKVLEKRGLGVNFGTLVGYSTLRHFLGGEEFRDLTENELAFLKKIIIQSFKEGAFGLSLDLTRPETRFINNYEIKKLAEVAADFKKVYSLHSRYNFGQLKEGVEEVIKIASDSKGEVEINYFEPLKEFYPVYRETLKLIEKESAQTCLNFDVSPLGSVISPIDNFLPQSVQEGGREKMIEIISSFHWEKGLLEHFSQIEFLKEAIIASVPPTLKFLSGKSLKEFAQNQEINLEAALLKLMRITYLKASLFSPQVDNLSLEEAMLSPRSFISSTKNLAPSLAKLKNCQTFLQFIRWTESRKDLLPLEKAISKITAGPAQKYRIFKRGFIKENYYADVVILRGNEPSEVIINGRLVLKDGKPEKILAGKVLKS
ncbi:hypothetical protein COZ81_01505 [Candidatus Jorgensenbacteria bacterium CG_4_8_14_3_um_filter_38_10]|nr:MAG: hypothetical protein COZ81_01505 [Candidatus Jorgensenbacteria bacterium CG_4_8_14_3_um_filter_38_10]